MGKTNKLWYLLPIIFNVLGGIVGYLFFRKKDRQMAKNMFYVGIGIFILPFILALVLSMGSETSTEAKTTTSTSSEILITKLPSEIGLTINDLSEGWMGNGEGNEIYYSSSFDKVKWGRTLILDCKVTKYDSLYEAKQAYNELKQESNNFKLKSVGLGDESFGWEYDKESSVVFRKSNAVIEITHFKEYGTASISDAKEYAELVEEKI